MRHLNKLSIGSRGVRKAKPLPHHAGRKRHPITQRAGIATNDIIRIPIPRPPTHQAGRRLNADLGDCWASEREDEEKS